MFKSFLVLIHGIAQYFVSRLTTNEPYEDNKMGDRTLAIWQGQGNYIFATCNAANGNANVVGTINYPADIEGVWTYIYYSYSVEARQAVGFIKFGDKDFETVVQPITHPKTNQVRFVLGGNDAKRYPGFNGLFTRVIFNDEAGAYISKVQDLQKLVASQGPEPSVIAKDFMSKELVEGVAAIEIPRMKIKLPHEYAISGWFKFVPPTNFAEWHSAFRVQVTLPGKDGTLGDRVLMYEIGKNGVIWSTSYTYENMNGAGKANIPKDVPHKDRPFRWHFVYQGYSKPRSLSYFIAKFTDSDESFQWTDVKHYFSGLFYIQLGSTQFLAGWSGQHALVSFHTGEGAFKVGKDYGHPQDAFKQIAASDTILKPNEKKEPPAADSRILESKSSQEAPLINKRNEPKNLVEYGYGFWLRFLTIYPERLPNGKNLPQYFVSRLTTNEPYEDNKMGDRTLAIWQGQGNYIFATCNAANGNANVVGTINYPADIEGVWTYIYYSYSVEARQAVGFIKFGDKDFETVVQPITHPKTNQVRFVLGGNDAKRYPGFNGLFTRVIFNDEAGAYISKVQDLQKLVASQGPEPSVIAKDFMSKELVEGVAARDPKDENKVIQVPDARLPHEYAISGWFKFVPPTNFAEWHSAFRVQVTLPGKDGTLGDRVLMYEIGKNGVIWSTSYTYENMNGAGKANIPKDVPHKDRPFRWHFVYQGYSKPRSLSYFIAKFTDSDESFQWTDVKHYFSGLFYIQLGSTQFLAGWSGQHALVSFHTGEGAFKVGKDYGHPQDAFKQIAASDTILKPNEKKEPPAADSRILESKSSQEAPLINKRNEPKNLVEYGYGFWLRFLTIYPERLPNGKNLPQYFVSRLTTNEPYEDNKMGDRTLAIWQGQGNYIFATCNAANGNANVVGTINYPADIEGVWTYIYYSYSVEARQAVGFIKFGDKDFETVVQPITHPKTNQVRFVLGGNDAKRYPGFNGLFTRVIFNDEAGAYISKVQDLQKLVASQGPEPSVIAKDFMSKELVEGVAARDPKDENKVIQVPDARLPHEYAISGWFKFVPPTNFAEWHSAFRVQVTLPGKDGTLGDRVLMYEIGKNGVIWSTSYTYENMNGAGKANIPKDVPHKDRPFKWHFVYQGYSKPRSLSYFIAKFTDSDESFQWTDVKHYFSGLFYIQLGSTQFLAGWSGQHALVSFHTGEGAFKVGKDYGHPQDAFKQIAASDTILKPNEKKEPPAADSRILESKSSQEAPLINKRNEPKNLVEYGYGFWLRFLTIYPERLPNGKNLPQYFVSRLTTNEPYEDNKMGDRTLAIWQGQGNYIFATCNTANGNANVVGTINYPDNIEGVWTYIYNSYSLEDRQAVAFIQFGSREFQTIVQPITHPKTNQVRFVLGGNDAKRYPGFNGLFTKVLFNDEFGAYISKLEDLQKLLASQGPEPSVVALDFISKELVQGVAARDPKDENKVIQVPDARLPHEYAISGWFKFVKPTNQADWHSAFRVQVTPPGKDGNLGDRVLMYEIGKNGVIWSTSYTYENMNGAGKANIPKDVPHKDRPFKWHFVYQGYSKPRSFSYFIAKFTDSDESFQWTDVKHYFSGLFYIQLGSTQFLAGWSGQHALVSFHTGTGSFRVGKDYGHPQDAFKIAAANTILNTKILLTERNATAEAVKIANGENTLSGQLHER